MQVPDYAIIYRTLISSGIFIDWGFFTIKPVSCLVIVAVMNRPFLSQGKSPPGVESAKEDL